MNLSTFFQINKKVAIAFSGGVDSAFLLYAALSYGATVRAYYVKSPFQPQFELEDAQKIANFLHADMKILEADVLSDTCITQNPPNRCFHCKKLLFEKILHEAKKDGFHLIVDGTNASDDSNDRPGMIALQELSIRSPLRECGLTKSEIRQLSKKAGLFTWNKPAYACLATRVPTGMEITLDRLEKTEYAETYLTSLGFSDFRVRILEHLSTPKSYSSTCAPTNKPSQDIAKLQVPASQLEAILTYRNEIITELKKYYSDVLLDLEARK